MKEEAKIVEELFTLMHRLSQRLSHTEIIADYVDTLNLLFPQHKISYQSIVSKDDTDYLTISSAGTLLGYLLLGDKSAINDKTLMLLQNSCDMLAMILKTHEQKRLLEDKYSHSAIRHSINSESFRNFIDSAPFAIVMSSGIEQITDYLNPEFTRLFGYTIADLPDIGKWWELAYPDPKYRQKVKIEWQGVIEETIKDQSVSPSISTSVTCGDGTVKHISWRFISTAIQNWTLGLDITEQKNIEEELVKQKDLFRLVIDTVPISIFWKDVNSVYVGCNSQFVKESCMASAEEVIGKNDDIMVWGYKAEKFRQDDKYVITTGNAKLHYAEDFIDYNGDVVWWETNKIPLRDREGKIFGVLATAQNFTSEKEALTALTHSEEKFRALYENSPFGIVICKMLKNKNYEYNDFLYLEANLSAAQITGFELAKLVGKKASELVDKESMKELVDLYSTVVKSGKSVKHEQYYEIYDKYLSVTAFSLHDDLFFINFIDITERKKADQELQQKMIDLETFNKAAVDREIVINDQRKEINELLARAGEPPKYEIVE